MVQGDRSSVCKSDARLGSNNAALAQLPGLWLRFRCHVCRATVNAGSHAGRVWSCTQPFWGDVFFSSPDISALKM
jgi:hypothetical protein